MIIIPLEVRKKNGKMNLVDLAVRRAELSKWKYSSSIAKYRGTFFIGIQENDHVVCSSDPNVLEHAKSCFVIHRRSELAYINYYDWFDVEYINENGETFAGCIDEDFSLSVVAYGSYSNQCLWLTSKLHSYHHWKPSWDNTASIKDCLQSAWNLYIELKQAETEEERSIIIKLYQKDETIFQQKKEILQQKKEIANFSYANALLEKERDMYKELLDDIRKLLPHENK